jgi:hypothetical protein
MPAGVVLFLIVTLLCTIAFTLLKQLYFWSKDLEEQKTAPADKKEIPPKNVKVKKDD